MPRSNHLVGSRAALAALLGATLLAAPALASSDDSPTQPPAMGDQPAPPPPAKDGAKGRDRGFLGGPPVDPLAAEGRQGFGREGRPGGGAARGEGRAMAMLVDAVKKTEPTPEQSEAIQLYLGEVREKARRFSEEHGEEMRQLMRVRGELVRAGEPTDEVDAELAELRAKVVNPREVVEKVTSLLDPERQEKLRDFMEAARRAAIEDARRRRGGDEPGMKGDGLATGADPMRDGPRRGRGGDAPRRRGADAPPLDLGDGPVDGAGRAPKDPANRPAPPPPPPPPGSGG